MAPQLALISIEIRFAHPIDFTKFSLIFQSKPKYGLNLMITELTV